MSQRGLFAKAEFAVTVRPVVALVDQQSVTDRRAQHNRPVAVLDARRIVAWLRAQPQQLSDTKLSLLKLAAEEPETWHIDSQAANTLRVMPRFERLVADVGTVSRPAAGARPRASVAPRLSPTPRAIRSTGRAHAARNGARAITALHLLKLWFAITIIVVTILAFRSAANQPCDSAISCIIPPLYLGMKPLLMLVGAAVSGLGGLMTVKWVVRKTVR